MGAAAAVILMKERQLVEAFERAGATTLASAGFPVDIGVEPSGIGWRRLRERAVVRETSAGSGQFYLDLEVWQAVRRTRWRVVLIVLVIVAALLLSIYLGAGSPWQ